MWRASLRHNFLSFQELRSSCLGKRHCVPSEGVKTLVNVICS